MTRGIGDRFFTTPKLKGNAMTNYSSGLILTFREDAGVNDYVAHILDDGQFSLRPFSGSFGSGSMATRGAHRSFDIDPSIAR